MRSMLTDIASAVPVDASILPHLVSKKKLQPSSTVTIMMRKDTGLLDQCVRWQSTPTMMTMDHSDVIQEAVLISKKWMSHRIWLSNNLWKRMPKKPMTDVGAIKASPFQEIKPLPICGSLRMWSVQKSLWTIELHTISEPFFILTKNNLNRIKFLNILLLQIVHNICPLFVLPPKSVFMM